MVSDLASRYKSPSQRTRVISEFWARENLYCPCCDAEKLHATRANTKALDYTCSLCSSPFELKASRSRFGKRLLDGAFTALTEAILSNRTPNLLLLHYNRERWLVESLTLIPWFAFTLSCVERRRPLSTNAQRSLYVGCNILLCNIPPDARVQMVDDGEVINPSTVRKKLRALMPIAELAPLQRGWTLDVLNVVRALRKKEFSLEDLYAHATDLQALHPKNRHVEAKIRQQLQRLRDFGYIRFLHPGHYQTVINQSSEKSENG